MSGARPEIRFGVAVDGRRSRCWRVSSAVNLPQIYVEREGLEKVAHISLHTSNQWQVWVKGKEYVHRWVRPQEVAPGFTRALVIVQPTTVATLVVDPPPGARVWNTPAQADPAVFNVFLEQPGANLESWPYRRSMGSTLVGRVPLAQGAGTCCVVAYRVPVPPAELHADGNGDLIDEMQRTAIGGQLYVTFVGSLDPSLRHSRPSRHHRGS